MTTTMVVGLIIFVLVILDLLLAFISKGDNIWRKIQIFIESSALILASYRLILKTNAGETVFATILLLIMLLVSLIQSIVYLVRK